MSRPGLSWVSVGFRGGEPRRGNTVELKMRMFPSGSDREGEEKLKSPASQKEDLLLPAICKSLLSLLQFYYFLHNHGAPPCSQQSPVHKYCTSNYKDAWRRAEPNRMGRSQVAYDSPRQKLARSLPGRSSDASKHDTVVFFRSSQRQHCSSSI